jgi:uncharacterized damage-inducible protein DinB
MSPTDLRELFRHMEWADRQVWRAVLEAPAARTDETLRRLLLHVHVVQRAFLNVWLGNPMTFPDVSEFPDVASIAGWIGSYYADANAFLDTVTEEALSRPVALPWEGDIAKYIGRPPQRPTLGETMFQVTSHTTHHRAQVSARLRSVGGEPPIVDYIAWIWLGRPAPAASAA